ncbi:peptidoglycan-associated lipoprotein [Gammaproteobacteria bacterium 45_16_T64]|nr:peptidoglycan-associated lipoprotein [Gammaproteobacteria bacterium 45_16_T64]
MAIFNRNHLLALIAAAAISGCTTVPDNTGNEQPADNTVSESTGASSGVASGIDDDSMTVSSETVGNGSSVGVDVALSITTVYFDFDKANIRPDAYAALKAHAAYLSTNAGAKLRLDGHADERGTREYNLALGERRAKAAASYLAANGATRSQLEVVSYGEERPAAMGASENSWAANRRVELKYTAVAP